MLYSFYSGGGKKRKKKVYTKPKRVPHKHKNVKLAVLNHYKVDKDGKVTRLRRKCTNPDCKTLMAMHKDGRQYCGKCHTTFVVTKN